MSWRRIQGRKDRGLYLFFRRNGERVYDDNSALIPQSRDHFVHGYVELRLKIHDIKVYEELRERSERGSRVA